MKIHNFALNDLKIIRFKPVIIIPNIRKLAKIFTMTLRIKKYRGAINKQTNKHKNMHSLIKGYKN